MQIRFTIEKLLFLALVRLSLVTCISEAIRAKISLLEKCGQGISKET